MSVERYFNYEIINSSYELVKMYPDELEGSYLCITNVVCDVYQYFNMDTDTLSGKIGTIPAGERVISRHITNNGHLANDSNTYNIHQLLSSKNYVIYRQNSSEEEINDVEVNDTNTLHSNKDDKASPYWYVDYQFNRYNSPLYTSINDYPQDLHLDYILQYIYPWKAGSRVPIYSFDSDKNMFVYNEELTNLVMNTYFGIGNFRIVTKYNSSSYGVVGPDMEYPVSEYSCNVHEIVSMPGAYILYNATPK